MTKGKALNKLSKSMCVLAAIAVGMVAWAEDSALARWRMAMATNGYAAVERKVKVSQDVRQAIWKSYREHIGYEGVQMSAPRLVSTNEFGAVYDLPFTTADGAKHDFCLCRNGDIQSPLAWVAVGYEQKKNAAETDVEAFVLKEILGGDVGKSKVYSPMRPLRDTETSLKSAFRNCEYDSPFDEYWLFFVDDAPMANWMHNARLISVRKDLSEFAVRYIQSPVVVSINGEIIKLCQVWIGESSSTAHNGRKARSLLSTSPKTEFPLATGGDGSKCYCLIVSGGCDVYNNHVRYWNDVCFAYNTMVKRYSIPRANVKVLWASGNPGKDLCYKGSTWCYNDCNQYVSLYPDAELSDFDQDGNNDVNGAATRGNLEAAFAQYASSLQATDQLFVFVTDHGGYYPETAGAAGKDRQATICLWGNESVSDMELASMTASIKCPIVFAVETCYGGGFKEELQRSSKNRIVITADDYDQSEGGNLSMDVWVYNFFSALCGFYPYGTYSTQLRGAAEIDVRHVGEACRSDYDGDGKVSFYEAAQFAYNNNPIASDVPQYEESTANLGKKLFMTQYADAPAVVVKEKVLTPTLSPASGSLGYAPAAVTASCGTSGATIRYTLDGSEPSARSAVYPDGITLTGDATVSIRAFKSGMEASDVVSIAYAVKKSAPEKALITSVSQGDSSSGIVVCWSGGSGTESYDLLRSESSSMSSAATIASGLAASTSSYADLTASPGKTYYYQIRSRNKYGTTLSAASQGAYLMLNPPDGVTATVASTKIGAATVRVDWDAAAGASYYRVYRKTSDGTLTALGSWQSSRTYTDDVPLSGAITKASYYVRSSAYSSGSNPSGYSREAVVTITSSSDDWQLMLNYPWHSTTDLGAICHRPGTSREYSCRLQYADGTFEQSGFVTSPSWRVKNGQGIALTSANGSFNGWSYRPPTVSVAVSATAPEQTATITASFTTPGGLTVTRDFTLFVTTVGVPKAISVSSPGFATPGETIQLGIETSYYGYQNWDDEPWEKPEATWTVIGGSGATITDDGELTAWPVTSKTSVTVQASINTLFGVLTAVKTLNISPAVITKQTAIIPPLGGESTNLVGKLTTSTYCECYSTAWISGIGYHGSKTTNPTDSTIHINVGYGRNSVGIIGSYLFMSFRAERNPGKDREMPFKLRWDGGGIDFTIIQKEAPYANDPIVSGGASGTITANSTTDGSVLHYATDGEEPSENSPVLLNRIDFSESTEFAVKAFGEWMQASDTVYTDVVGKNSQWDEVEISFVPVQAGLVAPAKRMYAVNETFGELPSFPKTNGLFFKGWTLHEGSDKLVSSTDSVPSLDATLYAVWSPVEEDKPSWVALPWNFKSAMSATMKVYDDTTGTYLDPSVCIIGIEDADGVCRGSSENGFGDMQSDLNGKDGLYVFGIYSQIESGKEEGLKIRIWNRQRGYMIAMPDSLSFDAASSLGSDTSPHVIHVASGYKVVFSANGGTVGESERMVLEGANIGELPEPTRSGHIFNGWYTSLEGGTKMSASEMVTGDMTLYAQWTANKYMVTFNANGGTGGWCLSMDYGAPITAPTVSRSGYTFIGWTPAVLGTVPAGDVTYTAQWKISQYTVVFDANGGEGGKKVTQDYGTALDAPTVTRAGHTFAGWSPAVPATVPAANATYVAQWTINRHNVTLVLNGGDGAGSVTVDYGTKVGSLPVPTRTGYTFLGWFTAASGGELVAADAAVTSVVTLYAVWEKTQNELWSDSVDGAAPSAAASEYNGYLYDENSGAVKGTIQVKIGKPNAKTGLATAKATVVIGAKKVSLKGADKGKSAIEKDGPTEIELVGGEACFITLGADGLSGHYGAYVIDGSRNFFASKDKAELSAANAILSKWLGSFMVVWDGGSLSVNIAAKGKVKVSGTLADGKTKVTANTVLLIGDEWSCVAVAAPKANLAFVLWLSHDGRTIEAEGLGDDVHVGLPGTLADGAAFHVDVDEFAAVFGQTMLPYLPDGVSVTQKGTKWTLPKAGKVVYKNGALDETKLGENPCGLKLAYTAKSGTFKGSFKVYAEVKGKPKATTVNVTGFLLNGIGYGTATIKGKGSVAVSIE